MGLGNYTIDGLQEPTLEHQHVENPGKIEKTYQSLPENRLFDSVAILNTCVYSAATTCKFAIAETEGSLPAPNVHVQ